jgi:hypothetical protein
MTAPQAHRLSLLLAITGAVLMLATAWTRLLAPEPPLNPGFESSRPLLPDWPTHDLHQVRS